MFIFLFIPLFIIASFLAFYVPGRVVLGNQKNLSKVGVFAVSIILGIVLWGWQGYLFGFLQLRWLSYLYLLVFLALFLKNKYPSLKIPKFNLKKIDWITLSIAVVGVIGQIIPFSRNGELSSSGLFISQYNSVDHVWHSSIIGELVRRFPPSEPGMFGVLLLNYHFWFHLVTAEMIRVFHLPLFQTQFVGMYGIGSVLLALITYVLAKSIYDSKLYLRVFLFFTFFAGNFGAQFMLFVTHRFDFTIGWLFEDATKFMDAPGSGLAIIISLASVYLLFNSRKQISKKNILLIGLLFGSIMGFKIYLAIPFILGLFCLSLFDGLKRNFSTFSIFLIASFVFLVQFLPFNASSGGLFFLPFDIPREFMAQQSLGLSYFDMRWAIYFEHHNYFRLLEYGLIMSALYLIAQFGFKLLGFVPLKRTIKTIGLDFYIFLYSAMVASLILGLFFYQKVGGANVWEFFLTTSVVLAILVSLNLSLYFSKFNKVIAISILALIIIITLPRWFWSVNYYLKVNYFSGFNGLSLEEYKSYEYLKNETSKNSNLLLIGQSYNVSFSSIASVVTERNLFFSGIGASQIVSPNIVSRKNDYGTLTRSINNIEINSILKKNKIDYIGVYNKGVFPIATVSSSLKKVFSNQSGVIYKVK